MNLIRIKESDLASLTRANFTGVDVAAVVEKGSEGPLRDVWFLRMLTTLPGSAVNADELNRMVIEVDGDPDATQVQERVRLALQAANSR